MELIATCAFGLEKLLYQEIKKLGLWVIKTEDGKVYFEGDEKAICNANLWLRTADRVLIKLAEFEAKTFDELFDEVSKIPWNNWIGRNDQFPVLANSVKSMLTSKPAIQSITKKAIVEKLKKVYDIELFLENTTAIYTVQVKFKNDRCLILLDTTGPSLHRRGYRLQQTEAPLKETLAAALIMLSDWTPEKPLLDPFCGSGTILFEAALIARNRAPGLNRTFESMNWPQIPAQLWQEAKQTAEDAIKPDVKLQLIGFDRDPEAIEAAKSNQARLKLPNIHFEVQEFNQLNITHKGGTLITNPPYAIRIGENAEVDEIYRGLGQEYQQHPDWSFFVLTAHPDFTKLFGVHATKNRKLFNGRIQCYYYQYFQNTPLPPKP